MDEKECRRILEVSDQAPLEEITHAYQRMKRLWENEQAVYTAPSMDEFAAEAREEVLAELEAAYRELERLLSKAEAPVHVAPVSLPEGERPDGRSLRQVRERQGLTLEYVSAQTHVRPEILRALEEERYWELPPAAVNVRGFLSAYAAEIGLPVDAVVNPYMERFLRWQSLRRG